MKRIALITVALVLLSFSYSFAGSEPSVTGTYLNKADKEYLTLNPDGTLYLKVRKKPVDFANPFLNLSGKYKVSGDEVTMELEGGGEASGKISGATFIDNEGKIWIKEGTNEPALMEPGPTKGKRK